MNVYICSYGSQRVEIRAHNQLAAHHKAVVVMKVPKFKAHMVSVLLAERADEDTVYVKQELL